MNLAIHALSGDLRYTEGGSLLDDQFQSLRADFVMANPPFHQKKWGADRVSNDARWKYGLPPDGNANYAWIQHFIAHLAPDGRAGFVMANGSLTSRSRGEGAIREAIVRDDLVDCVVACPAQLFYTTAIPVSLWFLDRNKASSGERDRRGETLLIDGRRLGQKVSRTQMELTADDIALIAGTYHAWRDGGDYEDREGFCRSATLADIEAHSFALTPARYVGAEEDEEDDESLDEKVARLQTTLAGQFAEEQRLQQLVAERFGVGEP
jgi:type I restriction enzyme M protein